MSENEHKPYPVFLGFTREPQTARFGIPFMPCVYALIFPAAMVAFTNNWYWWGLLPFLVAGIAILAQIDDKIFRLLGIWFETKFRNRNKRFWGGSSYSPSDYRGKRRGRI